MKASMPRMVARLILGLKPWHTKADADSALKRLVSTVHPDVCHGPEAKRLTQLALDARSAVLSAKPPRLVGVERRVDGIWTMKIQSAIRPVVGEVVTYVQDRDLGFIREFTLIEVIENRIGWFTCKATLNPR